MRIEHICLILPKLSWYSIVCLHPVWASVIEITYVRVHSTYRNYYSYIPLRHRGHVFFDHLIQHFKHTLWLSQLVWIISLCSRQTGQSPFSSKNLIFPIVIAQSTHIPPWLLRMCSGRFSLQILKLWHSLSLQAWTQGSSRKYFILQAKIHTSNSSLDSLLHPQHCSKHSPFQEHDVILVIK